MKKFGLIICLPALLLFGCVEPIVLDPGELGSGDENRPIVAECVINIDLAENPQELKLKLLYVKGKSESKDVPVEEEKMTACIIDGNDSIPFRYSGEGIWKSEKISIKTYHKYKLYIEIPGRLPIWAETLTPPMIFFGMKADDTISEEMTLSLFNTDVRKFPPESLSGCAVWLNAVEFTPGGLVYLPYLTASGPNVDEMTLTRKKFSELDFVGNPDPENYLEAYYKAVFDRAKENIPDYLLYEDFIRLGRLEEGGRYRFFAGPLTIPGLSSIGIVPNDDSGYACMNYYCFDKAFDQYMRSVYIYNQSLKSDLSFLYSSARDIYSNIHQGFGIFGSYYSGGFTFLRSAINDELWHKIFREYHGSLSEN